MDNDGFLPVERQEQELLMAPGREEVASLGHLEKYRSTNRYITVLR
jgi:anion-transporting  ArsA/GET3 family ATPase